MKYMLKVIVYELTTSLVKTDVEGKNKGKHKALPFIALDVFKPREVVKFCSLPKKYFLTKYAAALSQKCRILLILSLSSAE